MGAGGEEVQVGVFGQMWVFKVVGGRVRGVGLVS